MIARFMFSGARLPQGNVLLHIKNLARAVVECNEAFVQSKLILSTKIHSATSTSSDVNEYVSIPSEVVMYVSVNLM